MTEQNKRMGDELHSAQVAHIESHDLGEAILYLALESWITKDRLLVLEKALTDQGVLVEDLVNKYQPSDEFAKKLSEERTKFLEGLVKKLRAK